MTTLMDQSRPSDISNKYRFHGAVQLFSNRLQSFRYLILTSSGIFYWTDKPQDGIFLSNLYNNKR